jgi:hypothetical protein
MTPWGLWVITAACVVQAVQCIWTKQYPMAAVMAGYAFTDLALIWQVYNA